MLPALMSDLCYSVRPSECHEIHAPVKNQPAVKTGRASVTKLKTGRAPVTKLKRGRAPVTKLKGGRGPVTKLKGGPTESGVSPGPQTTPDTPPLRARAVLLLGPEEIIPSIRALAFSFFSDINRHHFSSVSELEAEGEPCR